MSSLVLGCGPDPPPSGEVPPPAESIAAQPEESAGGPEAPGATPLPDPGVAEAWASLGEDLPASPEHTPEPASPPATGSDPQAPAGARTEQDALAAAQLAMGRSLTRLEAEADAVDRMLERYRVDCHGPASGARVVTSVLGYRQGASGPVVQSREWLDEAARRGWEWRREWEAIAGVGSGCRRLWHDLEREMRVVSGRRDRVEREAGQRGLDPAGIQRLLSPHRLARPVR